MKRTLLFDLDGTLSDNRIGICASIRHACVRLGHPSPDDAMLVGCVGPPLRETFARLLAANGATIERAIDHYRERFATVGWSENQIYPGIPALLARLREAGNALYVCTSKPQLYARRIVDHFGFMAHFVAVYGADLDGRLDDKRALLAHLIERERIDCATAVMIGDRMHDIRAAKAYGVRTIGVLWGYGSREELAQAGADDLVATPRELEGVLL